MDESKGDAWSAHSYEPPRVVQRAIKCYCNQNDINNTEVLNQLVARASGKRICGAAALGLAFAIGTQGAFNIAVPALLGSVAGTDVSIAGLVYNQSLSMVLATGWISTLVGAVVAGYIATLRGVLAGFLSGLPPFAIIVWAVGDALAGRSDTVSYLVTGGGGAVILLITAATCVSGGWIGERAQSHLAMLDAGNRRTVFGILWWHYLWVLPLVAVPYVAGCLLYVAITAIVFAAMTEHPFVLLVWQLTALVIAGTVPQFWSAIRASARLSVWGRLWRRLLFGPLSALFTVAVARWSLHQVAAVVDFEETKAWAMAAVLIFPASGFYWLWSWVAAKAKERRGDGIQSMGDAGVRPNENGKPQRLTILRTKHQDEAAQSLPPARR